MVVRNELFSGLKCARLSLVLYVRSGLLYSSMHSLPFQSTEGNLVKQCFHLKTHLSVISYKSNKVSAQKSKLRCLICSIFFERLELVSVVSVELNWKVYFGVKKNIIMLKQWNLLHTLPASSYFCLFSNQSTDSVSSWVAKLVNPSGPLCSLHSGVSRRPSLLSLIVNNAFWRILTL